MFDKISSLLSIFAQNRSLILMLWFETEKYIIIKYERKMKT